MEILNDVRQYLVDVALARAHTHAVWETSDPSQFAAEALEFDRISFDEEESDLVISAEACHGSDGGGVFRGRLGAIRLDRTNGARDRRCASSARRCRSGSR